MAKEANFVFLAIFSGVSRASQSYSQVFRPCFSVTTRRSLTVRQHPGHKKEVPTECYFNRDFRKAAAAYSPTWWGSTIGASELNFSVRYGKRWFLTAITAAVYYLREIS